MFKFGDLVLLISKDEKYLVEVRNQRFNVKSGYIELSKLKNKNFGDKIKTHLGKIFHIARPNLSDIIENLNRMQQIITPKDFGMILAYTGIAPDSLILDAGTGSGFLAISLAYYANKGRVITYEKDKRAIKVARKNIKLSKLKNIRLKVKNVKKGFDEKNADLITLDLQNPEKIVPYAYKSLKIGGWLVIYSPTVEELINSVKKIKNIKGFSEPKIMENIVRMWQSEVTTRPKTTGLLHTGFLIFTRKVE
ncbi:MAG: tRNA (adenine-N1)-methyltransferase [Candidatus Aenigmatarchaeota archaeon]